MDTNSSSLMDPALVLVVGAVDDQGMLQSPGSSASKKDQKKKVPSSENTTNIASKPAKSSADKPAKSVSDSKSAKFSADAKINQLDPKWLDRFNRLVALPLARTLEKLEPTFQTVKVTPMQSPPVGSVKATEPFIKQFDQPNVAFRSRLWARARDLWVGTYEWKVLTVLNNPPTVCLCVDVNKHKSHRKRNKRNHNISLSTMQKIYISFVIRFLGLFVKILSTETFHLTCFL